MGLHCAPMMTDLSFHYYELTYMPPYQCSCPLDFLLLKILPLFVFKICLTVSDCPFGIFKLFFALSIPDEGNHRSMSCALNLISMFLFQKDRIKHRF